MIARYAVTGVLGFVITLTLFLVMQELIDVAREKDPDVIQAVSVDFVRSREDTEVQTKERKLPPKPEDNAAPKAPELDLRVARPSNDTLGTLNLAIPKVEVAGTAALGAMSDGEEQPLVRIEPQYPSRASSRGIEGWVLLEFTVTETGAVSDAKVVDHEPSGIFDSAALRAVAKWKYKPKVVNGKGVPRQGVQIVLRFNLADEGRGRR